MTRDISTIGSVFCFYAKEQAAGRFCFFFEEVYNTGWEEIFPESTFKFIGCFYNFLALCDSVSVSLWHSARNLTENQQIQLNSDLRIQSVGWMSFG